jgi:sugar (pentulose or hexulose) kinase
VSDVLIGLDVGTTGAKAVAISDGGKLLASGEEP